MYFYTRVKGTCATYRRESTSLSKPTPPANNLILVEQQTNQALYVVILLGWDLLSVRRPPQLHTLDMWRRNPVLGGSEGCREPRQATGERGLSALRGGGGTSQGTVLYRAKWHRLGPPLLLQLRGQTGAQAAARRPLRTPRQGRGTAGRRGCVLGEARTSWASRDDAGKGRVPSPCRGRQALDTNTARTFPAPACSRARRCRLPVFTNPVLSTLNAFSKHRSQGDAGRPLFAPSATEKVPGRAEGRQPTARAGNCEDRAGRCPAQGPRQAPAARPPRKQPRVGAEAPLRPPRPGWARLEPTRGASGPPSLSSGRPSLSSGPASFPRPSNNSPLSISVPRENSASPRRLLCGRRRCDAGDPGPPLSPRETQAGSAPGFGGQASPVPLLPRRTLRRSPALLFLHSFSSCWKSWISFWGGVPKILVTPFFPPTSLPGPESCVMGRASAPPQIRGTRGVWWLLLSTHLKNGTRTLPLRHHQDPLGWS